MRKHFFYPPRGVNGLRDWLALLISGALLIYALVDSLLLDGQPLWEQILFPLFAFLPVAEPVLVNALPRRYAQLVGWLRLLFFVGVLGLGGYYIFEGQTLTSALVIAGCVLVLWFAFSSGPTHARHVEQPHLLDDPTRWRPR